MMYFIMLTPLLQESSQNASEEITTASDENGVKNVMASFDGTQGICFSKRCYKLYCGSEGGRIHRVFERKNTQAFD